MSDISPTRPVGKMDDIDVCPQDGTLPRGSSVLMVGGDSSKPGTYTPRFIALPVNLLRIDPNFKTWWNPDLSDFNQIAATLERLGWRSVCRRGEGDRPELIVSKTVGKPAGIFGSCSEQNAALGKIQLDMRLTPAVAKYIASKFPESTGTADGCSSVKDDGRIYYKIKADWGAIKIARDGIWDDIKANGGKGSFPPGVDRETARKIADFLLEIAKQDPYIAMKANAKEGMDAMRENVNKQIGIMVAIQLATTGVFASFFLKQIKLAQKTLDRLEAEKKGDGSALERYGRNLNQEARNGRLEPMNTALRGREIEAIRAGLLGDRSVVLTGKAGVGKTAIAEGLAAEIEAGRVPELKGVDIIMLDLNKVVAGTKYRGEFEERLQVVLDEVKERNGVATGAAQGGGIDPARRVKSVRHPQASTGPHNRVILFVDELHRLMGWGGAEGATDASQIVKPGLARGELIIIGATTTEEFRKHIASDKALAERFKDVYVRALSVAQTFEALRTKLTKYGKARKDFPKMEIPNEALQALIEYADEHMPENAFPRKADNILKDLIAWKRLQCAGDPKKAATLTMEDVNVYIASLKANGSAGAGQAAEAAHGEAPPNPVAQIRAEQIRLLSELIMRMPEFMGHADIISEVGELAYERLSRMSSRAKGDPEKFKKALLRCKKDVLARRAGGVPTDPGASPTAGAPAAGGTPAGTGGAAPAGSAPPAVPAGGGAAGSGATGTPAAPKRSSSREGGFITLDALTLPARVAGRSAKVLAREAKAVGAEVAVGGIPFVMGEIGSELLVNGRAPRLSEVTENYVPIGIGGSVGHRITKAIPKGALGAAEPIARRGIPLFMALTLAEYAKTGRVDLEQMPLAIANIVGASGAVHFTGRLLMRSSWVRRAAQAFRLVKAGAVATAPESGGTTLLGAAIVSVAEFYVLKQVGKLEERLMLDTEASSLRRSYADAVKKCNELVERNNKGEKISYLDLIEAEKAFYKSSQQYEQFMQARIEMLNEQRDELRKELNEEEMAELAKPLDGSRARVDIRSEYERKRRELVAEYSRRIGEIENSGREDLRLASLFGVNPKVQKADLRMLFADPRNGFKVDPRLERSADSIAVSGRLASNVATGLEGFKLQMAKFVADYNEYWSKVLSGS